jgi:signal transduction histidine kinase
MGGTATPMPLLFMAHIILVSLFFRPTSSLVVTGIGFGCAWGAVLLSSGATVWYGAILGGGFLFCWYLTSTITQSLKLREAQLEESNSMLEQLDRDKTQATLRATHELKAPFAAIKSYVYLLRDGYCGELPEKALEAVGRIGDRCDRLTNMITAILHVGNLRTAVVSEADFEPVDLVAFMVPEIEEAVVLAGTRHVTVKAEPCKEAQLFIRAAPRHLHTMISNLLRNAISYSNEGGAVEVAVIAVKRNAVLRVTDHGIGIAHDVIPKIFDDFFRSNTAVRINPHGNGLGLTLVKEVAKLHGATIEVASEEGKGTIFWVWFKRITPPAQGDAAEQL